MLPIICKIPSNRRISYDDFNDPILHRTLIYCWKMPDIYIFEEMVRLLILHNENLVSKCKAMKYANIGKVLFTKY